ncbi:MAG: hypothetical protein NTX53_11300 [candidate division WOR-3 bacterium]|nr:hypothetical protein [candidate division WOR-3 bacterium]
MSDVTRRLSRWKAKYSPEIAAQTTARIYARPNPALYLGGGFLSGFLGVAPPIDNHPEPAMLT